MRNCSICGDSGRREIMHGYCGMAMNLYECVACGFRYVDEHDLTQGWFDRYYLTTYRTDDKPYSDKRLASLADFIADHVTDVLDIGGMDGELQSSLRARGVSCDVAGVGDRVDLHYRAVCLSHTLEHIYDVPAMFKRIDAALSPADLLVVEVPVHLEYAEPMAYDYHWQHINKFRPADLERLFESNHFSVIEFCQLPDYREYKCWRIAGRKGTK